MLFHKVLTNFFRLPCNDYKSMRYALDFSHQSRLPRKGRGFGDKVRFAKQISAHLLLSPLIIIYVKTATLKKGDYIMSSKQTENEMTNKANELLDEEFELDNAALDAITGGALREMYDSNHSFDTGFGNYTRMN